MADPDEDSKMKSQRSRSNAGDHSSMLLEEEPKNDFQKASDVVDQANVQVHLEHEH